jgi:glutathione S-transferase
VKPAFGRESLCFSPLELTRATPEIDLSAYPSVKAYLERMRAGPSVATALATEIPLFHAEMARRKAA